MAKIKVKLLNDECMPVRTHRWDAGWDLKATEDVTIKAGEMQKVHTGVIIEVPPRHCGMVVPRSSFGTKHRVTLANDVGIIDSEYRGEVMVFLTNDSKEDFTIKQYDRFAQLVIVAINSADLVQTTRLSITGRGDGGFGSTTAPVNNLKDAKDIAAKQPEFDNRLEDINVDSSKKPLKSLSPSEWIALSLHGQLKTIYPEATGDMKKDLCIK